MKIQVPYKLMRYLDVVEGLRAQLARGDVAAGGALASESEIGAAFGASRATVRKALEHLRNDGLVFSRRGSGWFAAHDPVHQALGRVTTVEAALEAVGAVPQRRVLQFAFEPANSEVAGELRIVTQAEVLRVHRLNLADGQPFALVTVWLPGELGRYLSRAEVEIATFYDLLPLRGVELGRAIQHVGAAIATADDAHHLNIDRGAAMLTGRRVTFDRHGVPVLFSLHRYPAERTSIEIELPSLAFETSNISGDHHEKSRRTHHPRRAREVGI